MEGTDLHYVAFRYLSKEVVVNISQYLSEADINKLMRTASLLYDKLKFELYRRNARGSSSALRWAAMHDNAAMAKLCLSVGACQGVVKVLVEDPLLPWQTLSHYADTKKSREPRERYEVTPLWIAAAHGSNLVAQILIDSGADLEICSPLSAAVCCGHEHIVRVLLSHEVTMEEQFDWERTALEIAVEERQGSIVELLLTHGANHNLVLNDNDDDCDCPLIIALQNRDEDIACLLIQHGAGTDRVNSYNDTVLGIASNNEMPNVIRLLLEGDSDFEIEDSGGDMTMPPLGLAATGRDLESVRMILQAGADIEGADIQDGFTALAHATVNDDLEMLTLLIDSGANIESRDFRQRTPLMYAANDGLLEVLKTLLEVGAKADARERDDNTALHHAVMEGFLPAVELLAPRAPIDAINKQCRTPMMLACGRDSLAIIQSLLDNGADIETSIAAAITGGEGELKTLRILLTMAVAAGGKPRKNNLLRACLDGNTSIVEALLEAGTEFQSTPGDSRAALPIAIRAGRKDVVRLLLGSGAKLTDEMVDRAQITRHEGMHAFLREAYESQQATASDSENAPFTN